MKHRYWNLELSICWIERHHLAHFWKWSGWLWFPIWTTTTSSWLKNKQCSIISSLVHRFALHFAFKLYRWSFKGEMKFSVRNLILNTSRHLTGSQFSSTPCSFSSTFSILAFLLPDELGSITLQGFELLTNFPKVGNNYFEKIFQV